MFLGYRNKGGDRSLSIPLQDDATQFSKVMTVPGLQGPRAISAIATGGRRPEGFQNGHDGRTDQYQFGLSAVYRHEAWRWSFDIASSQSRYQGQNALIDYAYTSIPVRELLFDIQEGSHRSSSFRLRDFDPLDPNNYLFRGFYDSYYHSSGDDLQLRTDLDFIPETGMITVIQTGLRSIRRTAAARFRDYYEYTEPDGIPLGNLPIDFINGEPGFDGDRLAPIRSWFTPHPKNIRRNVEQLRALVGRSADDLVPEFPQFRAKENAHAAYGQIQYEFMPGILIDGALGMRVVRTQADMGGLYDDNQGAREWRVTRNTYTDYLPNASMRLHFSDALQLRLAATKTRTRAEFGQLNATTTIGQPSSICIADPRDENCLMFSNSGNPELSPLRSTNYDRLIAD